MQKNMAASSSDGSVQQARLNSSKYCKTKIPILSKDYKSLVSQVKSKKLQVEEKEAEILRLKADFQNLGINKKEKELPSLVLGTTSSASSVSTATPTLRDHSSGRIRTVIRTPGGSKRKVKPSHVKFRFELETALQSVIEAASESQSIKADELISVLNKNYPASRYIDRKRILKTVSEIYGKSLQRKGKQKEGYYFGLTLKATEERTSYLSGSDETVLLNTTSSPLSKSSRNSTALETPQHRGSLSSCRGRLSFTEPKEDNGMTNIEEETNENVAELKSKIKELENQISELQDTAGQVIESQSEAIAMLKTLIEDSSFLGGTLTLSERNQITSEVKKAKQLFNLGIRGDEVKDIEKVINPLLFAKLVNQLKEQCPMITNVLEQLVLSRNASRNVHKTQMVKMKAAVHLLSSILDVRDQNGHNDIQLLFGMLCVSYGARSSMIELLQHIGLTESFPVICNVLKKQLDCYKEIINARVSPDRPVVTYQDNIQMQRTSMRHLRLSKLQKDKKKQDKMWDFTVRGWRACDITDIEDLFEDQDTAKKPQRNVADLKFEDLSIECHKEQHEKWVDFRERNLLRKMDLALNQVQLSSTELLHATADQLKKMSDDSLSSHSVKQYAIEVPPVPEEFPESSLKSAIYPLPISIENQCTTLGLARNLDKFSEEFHFSNGKEKEAKFLPLRKGKAEFNLDLAYDRYSFLKTMEVHKKDQLNYEQFLRNSAENESVVAPT